MNDLVRRQLATKKTLNKYRDKPFSFENSASCVHMFRSHSVSMGHTMPAMPRIRSKAGAARALKDNGWNDVSDMMDAYFTRIAPAEMLLGDMASLPSSDGWGALVICVGDKFVGWHDSDLNGLKNIIVKEFDGAWRL